MPDRLAHIKARALGAARKATGATVFIETGTAGGRTVDTALQVGFDMVITIELNDGFYRMAAQRFLFDHRVRCLHGDSGLIIQDVMSVLDQPAVVLLDAHFTHGEDDVRSDDFGDTPVVTELEHVVLHPIKHYVLIDDARLFGTDPAYPTLDWVRARAAAAGYDSKVQNDLIHLNARSN